MQLAEGRFQNRIGNGDSLWIGTIIVLLVSFCFSIYKASLASVTHDEAYSFLFLSTLPISEIFKSYQLPNNHILHTLLLKLSTLQFGDSRLALRIPALLGAAAFFASFFYLCRAIRYPFLWSALIFTALVPGIYDFNASARGYSLGCAFWMIGTYCLARTLLVRTNLLSTDSNSFGQSKANEYAKLLRRAPLVVAGISYGLAIACVPTFILACFPTCLAYLLIRTFPLSHSQLISTAVDGIALAAAAGATCLLFYFQIHTDPTSFAWGYGSFHEFQHHFWKVLFKSSLTDPNSHLWLSGLVVALISFNIIHAILSKQWALLHFSLSFLFSILLLFILPLFGVLYPFERAGIFFIPLIGLELAHSIGIVSRYLRTLTYPVAALPLLLFGYHVIAVEVPNTYLNDDLSAPIEEALLHIHTEMKERKKVAISIHHLAGPSVGYFYRRHPDLKQKLTDVSAARYVLSNGLPPEAESRFTQIPLHTHSFLNLYRRNRIKIQ